MAETALRAYIKEVDDLVEREQLDEAIAHCRHILESYPKHLDTYRLLGKAYLEAKRYGDAADIFQRVLSAVPDDFVSQVGMSIVREDEGNLDASIWHMERAFETTPANPAIQQELRRLVGRRDGIEPHKVRLTRGALARMYAQGELYPQAAAELRAALQEDFDRPDLQAALAEMYWKTGQRTEAAEMCAHILEKLPYCREANRIIAAAYQSSGKSQEATPYHRRLAMLDPYAAFVENAMVDPRAVDANSVMIERLEWFPGMAVPTAQPDWATTLGVQTKTETPSEGAMPGWLAALEADHVVKPEAPKPVERPAAAKTPTSPFAGDAQHGPVPEWMRQAGWQEATGEAREGPVSFSDEEMAALDQGQPVAPSPGGTDELAPAELPDWVQAIAPREAVPEPEGPPALPPPRPPPAAEVEPAPSWMEEPGGQPAGPLPGPIRAEPSPAGQAGPQAATPLPSGEVPNWLESPADGASSTIVAWLGDRRPEGLRPSQPKREPLAEPEPKAVPEAEPAARAEEAPPAWLSEAEPPDQGVPLPWLAEGPAEAELEVKPEEQGPPAWVSGIKEAAAQPEPLRPEEMEWLRDREESAAKEEPQEEWLAQLEASEEAEMPPEKKPPDWLRGVREPETPATPPTPPAESPATPAGADWLRGIAEPPAPAGGEGDWLRGIAEPEKAPPQEDTDWLAGIGETPQAQAQPAESDIDWLKGFEQPEQAPEPAEEPAAAWLSAMAEAAPPPDVEIRPAGPAEPESETPGWLQEFAAAETGGPAAGVQPGAAEEPGFQGVLDWLREPASEVSAEPAAGGGYDVWPEPSFEAPAAPEAELPEAVDEDQALRWLEGLAARQTAGEPGAPPRTRQPGAELPAFMAEAAAPRSELPPEEPEEGLDWLERLATERGIDAQVTPMQDLAALSPRPQAPVPEPPQPAETVPSQEWLRQPAEAAAPEPEPAAEAGMEEALEWLPPTREPVEPPDSRLAWRPIDTSPAAAGQPPVEAAPLAVEEPVAAGGPEQAEDEVPDWLRAMVEETPPAVEAEELLPPEPQAEVALPHEAEAGDEMDLWLRGVPEEAVPLEAEPAPAEPEDEIPAWFGAEEETSLAGRAHAPIETAPDWLTAAEEPSAEEAGLLPVEPEAETPAAEEEVPAWVWGAGEPVEAAPADLQAPEPELEAPQLSWSRDEDELASAEEIESAAPSWLAEQEPSAVEPAAPAPVPLPTMEAAPVAEEEVAPLEEMITPAGPPPTPVAVSPRPPAEPEEPAKPTPPKPKPAAPASSELLAKARRALASGDLDQALVEYAVLVRKRKEMEAVIEDLQAMLVRSPEKPAVWQALGDAYMKANRLADAREAYKNGLESI